MSRRQKEYQNTQIVRKINQKIIDHFKAQASKLHSMTSNFDIKLQKFSLMRARTAQMSRNLQSIDADLHTYRHNHDELSTRFQNQEQELYHLNKEVRALEHNIQVAREQQHRNAIQEMNRPLLEVHDRQLALYDQLTEDVQNAPEGQQRDFRMNVREHLGRAEESVRTRLQETGQRLPFGPDAVNRHNFLDD